MIGLSIIIPILNSEKYIEETIKSITEQDFKNYEVLCLCCPSTDKSTDIVKKLSEEDERIKNITRPMEYAGISRNYGITQAKGEYILFLDSDDVIPLGALSYIYSEMKSNQSDFTVFNAAEWSNGQIGRNVFNLSNFDSSSLTSKKSDYFSLPNFVWAKCYKLKFLLDNDIKFSDVKFAEDVIFNVKSYYCAKKIGVSDKVVYLYRQNLESATNKFDLMYKDLLLEYEKSFEFLKNNYSNKYTIKSFSRCMMMTFMYFYNHRIKNSEAKKNYYSLMRKIIKNIKEEDLEGFYVKEFRLINKCEDFKKFNKKYNWKLKLRVKLLGIPLVSVKSNEDLTNIYLFDTIKIGVIKRWKAQK